MITAQQMRAARALAGIDQRQLAERAGVSLPTIQRMPIGPHPRDAGAQPAVATKGRRPLPA